jgi:hypothetical protein
MLPFLSSCPSFLYPLALDSPQLKSDHDYDHVLPGCLFPGIRGQLYTQDPGWGQLQSPRPFTGAHSSKGPICHRVWFLSASNHILHFAHKIGIFKYFDEPWFTKLTVFCLISPSKNPITQKIEWASPDLAIREFRLSFSNPGFIKC